MSLVISLGRIGLAVGMDWRLLPASTSRQQAESMVREVAKDNDASRITVATRLSDGQRSIGLFVEADAEDGTRSRTGKLYAATAVLAQMAGEAQNVIAAISFKDAAERDRFAVLAVEGGLPVSDVVQSLDKAIDTIRTIRAGEHGFSGHRVFSNVPEAFGDQLGEVEPLPLEDLAKNISSSARLVRPPLNVRVMLVTMMVFASVLASIGGGKLLWDGHQAKKKAAEVKAHDPVPKYEAALSEQIGHLGMDREWLGTLLTSLEGYPGWVSGWELKQVDCSLQACRSTWERRGGTTAALLSGRPAEKLEVADSSADKAVLSWLPTNAVHAGLKSRQQAKTTSDAMSGNLPIYQTWANAGIRLQQGAGYSVWPNIGLEVPPEVALKSQPIEVRLPFVLAREAVQQSPADVFWNQLSVIVDLAGKGSALQVILKGNSYVR